MNKKTIKQETPKKSATYSKAQLISSKKFGNQKDMLDALLAEDKQYSIKEVQDLIQKFTKGKVK